MKRAGRIRRDLWGPAIGIGVTVIGVVALTRGMYDRLNDFGFDWHFTYFGTLADDPRIVLIDINDYALRSVGDWPWPRRRYAQLVSTLDRLGAEVIALDLVLSEPSEPRRTSRGKHYDVDEELVVLGDSAWAPEIFDDDELRDAIAAAGNVYLAMFFRLGAPGYDPEAVFSDALELLIGDQNLDKDGLIEALEVRHPRWSGDKDGDTLWLRARLVHLLEEEFGLDTASLLERIGGSSVALPRDIESHLPAAKDAAALRLASRFRSDRPGGSFSDFYESALGVGRLQAISADRNTLLEAYRKAMALEIMVRANRLLPEAMTGMVRHAYDLTLPLDKLAAAARGIGFVSFDRDDSGGVIRSIPLFAEAEKVLVGQLGLAVALDVLKLDSSAGRAEGRWLTWGRGEHERRIFVTQNGTTPFNWHVPRPSMDWRDSFHHIPVSRVLEIPLNDEAAEENVRRLGIAFGELVKLRHADTQAVYAEYVELVNQRLGRAGDEAGQSVGADERDKRIESIESDALVWLHRVHGLWQSQQPENEQQRRDRDAIQKLYRSFVDDKLQAHTESLNGSLAERNRRLEEELRPRVDGKICLVGYTAAGMADMVSSPIYESVPGVMAHANVINTILQNRPIAYAPVWLNVVAVLFVCAVIVAIGCVSGPVVSVASVLALMSLVLLVSGALFSNADMYVSSPTVVVQSFLAWASVTAYRQFSEERSRRQFQRALGQYTSPAVAARIARSNDATDLQPQPIEATCFFSDLRGFTSLSEQLGASRTRQVLNPYLRAMSDVLIAHGAIVNKFMGDGIFAFFNAPILPCDKHSEAACASAVACLAALERLNQSAVQARGVDPLVMRIGIATGEVFVGDYGSDVKLDYTCIGDTVNLASRLEGANKALGTTILVNAGCRENAGDRFTFESLGAIDLPGVSAPVSVFGLNPRSA